MGTLVLKRLTTVLNLKGVLVIISGGKSGLQVVVTPPKCENTNDDAREFT